MSGLDGPEKLVIVPIFAALPPEQQARVFEDAPTGFKKGDVVKTMISQSTSAMTTFWSRRSRQTLWLCKGFCHSYLALGKLEWESVGMLQVISSHKHCRDIHYSAWRALCGGSRVCESPLIQLTHRG